jgi:hypothetical protein
MTTALVPIHVPKVPRQTGTDPVVMQLLRNAVYCHVSNTITYATTSGGTAFQLPRYCAMLSIGLNTTVAWNGTAMKLQIGDGSTVDLYGTFGSEVLGSIGQVSVPILSNSTTSTRTVVVTITLGGSTAGTSTLWVTCRMNSNFRGLSADKNAVP